MMAMPMHFSLTEESSSSEMVFNAVETDDPFTANEQHQTVRQLKDTMTQLKDTMTQLKDTMTQLKDTMTQCAFST